MFHVQHTASSSEYSLQPTRTKQTISALCNPHFNIGNEEVVYGIQSPTSLVRSDVHRQVFSVLNFRKRAGKHPKILSPKRRAALKLRIDQITNSLHRAEMQSEGIV